ncbi:hypothetical protein AArc1_2404 [Natrarchaeobaculum sulfurireducens]|uniref:Uncharacterized protein n=1 Tax=Natrarchaeobaculum sulfurireducens TaxID=2044521 RepID=A0A346PGS4_9EURY|nr:hypothetical protein AArc1_2404 [Natrarchaeobaculum sulfurireducens]
MSSVPSRPIREVVGSRNPEVVGSSLRATRVRPVARLCLPKLVSRSKLGGGGTNGIGAGCQLGPDT